MNTPPFSTVDLVQTARFSSDDLTRINACREPHTRLGFGYQLAFVRLYNRLPSQQPLEIVDEILSYVSVQLDIETAVIQQYQKQERTIRNHQQEIRRYLGLQSFGETEIASLNAFLIEEACRLEQIGPLLVQAKQFLQQQGILLPADDTLRRLIVTQRQAAREHIFNHIHDKLTTELKNGLDTLLETGENRVTPFHQLKQTPGRPTPKAMLRLAKKLEKVEATKALTIDLSWLNNNYQRFLTRYARRCSADRLRNLQAPRRYAVMVCFLQQVYQDTIDHMIDMHHKIMTAVYNRAQDDINEQHQKQRQMIRHSLATLHTLGQIILDESIGSETLRDALFKKVDRETLTTQLTDVESWLTGKYSHVFNLVVQRYSYLRQYAPTFLHCLDFKLEEGTQSKLVDAIKLLRELNQENKRKLPDDAPLGFLPKRLRPLIENEEGIRKAAWECALLVVIRDEIRAGNLYVAQSKRFGRFDDFFIADTKWQERRDSFFQRAGLPSKAEDVPGHLTKRLNQAFDDFLETLPQNSYASVGEKGWQLSVDAAEKLDSTSKKRLDTLVSWLSEHLRHIKLPELLIEVDNELHYTRPFLPTNQQDQREAERVCTTLATIMAHGCNVGPYTMAQLTEGITYKQIKQITDWQLTEEAQRQALALVVNAISSLDITPAWGKGKTSSSDGQRFRLKRRVLQQTYSHRFHDYALEFYSFVADNYAPFYSTVIECTERDAPYVLDGLLYNESDLLLDEHYTDTHGYTEINFAAFAMLGRRFAPRIRGLHKQRIYRIDRDKDYGALAPLVNRSGHTIHLDWICDQWDRMGHFYASLEGGHATASTALKRLAAFNGKNHFYRANRELGRIFKTEHVLRYMADPVARQRIRRGLLKSEELHALARQVAYGKQGKITGRDLHAQQNTSSCLTLIMACIIYWQAKELNRIVLECDPDKAGIDLALLAHISPIGWENIVLYGEYVLNRSLIER